jgi:hypothetical protein
VKSLTARHFDSPISTRNEDMGIGCRRGLFGGSLFAMRWVICTAAAVWLLMTAGCSAPKSRVHGKVLYKGKPVAGGTIVFLCPDNTTAPARIASDGSYEVAKVSRGHIRVAIQADMPRPTPRAQPNSKAVAIKAKNTFAADQSKSDDRAKGARAGPLNETSIDESPPPSKDSRALALPAKYGNPNVSELSFELVDREQEFSVDLK